MTRKIKIVFFLMIPIIAGLAIYWSGIRAKKKYEQFMSASIDGKLTYISGNSNGTFFKIQGHEIKYNFFPYTSNELNDGFIFSRIAKIGDRVYKEKNSDTLTLFHEERVLKYTFEHLK